MSVDSGIVFSVLGVTLATIAVVVALLVLLNQRQQQRRYDEERNRAEIETMRHSLESRIYELNERMMATEARWRDANHLLLSSQEAVAEPDARPSKVPLTNFLNGMGVDESDLTVDDKLVFVLTPFHDNYQETYEVIRSLCTEAGFRCLRGDEQFVAGDILAHILQLLVQARLVIANIDGRNPNVFYELGFAHALDKSTIMVARTAADLPFDIRTKRILLYDNYEQLQSRLRTELLKVLAASQ